MIRLKAGDLIKCHDREDLKRTLADLDTSGCHAVVTDVSGKWIRIVSDGKEIGGRSEWSGST